MKYQSQFKINELYNIETENNIQAQISYLRTISTYVLWRHSKLILL